MNLLPLRLEIEVSGRLPTPSQDELLRAVERGTHLVAEYIQALWVNVALEVGPRGTGEYIRGIQSDGIISVSVAPEGAPGLLAVSIEVTNTSEHASIVEDGHGAFSLVQAIDWNAGGRIKQAKDGTRYLHIPFRHAAYAAPDSRTRAGLLPATLRRMMPQEVYAKAQRLARRIPANQGPIFRPTPTGPQFMAADRYNWEGKGAHALHRGEVRTGFHQSRTGELFEERRSERRVGRDRFGPLVNPEWKTSRFEGMFKSGPKGHSSYMTIRTLTQKSQGWNIPAQVGYGIARRVEGMVASRDDVAGIMQAGIQELLG